MIRPVKTIDQVTKSLLQKATVRKPSEEFTPRLMKMVEREREVIRGTSGMQLKERRRPWGALIFSGICLAVLGGSTFLILRGIFPHMTFGPGITKMLALPANYPGILISYLREYFFIPIVINVTCLLIVLDRILRNRGTIQTCLR